MALILLREIWGGFMFNETHSKTTFEIQRENPHSSHNAAIVAITELIVQNIGYFSKELELLD